MSGDRRRPPHLYLLLALLVWPLVAFGGRSAATATTFGIGCLLLVAVVRRGDRAARGLDRGLERALLALVMIVALMRIPLPSSIVAVVSPHAAAVRSALALGPGTPGALVPLTIDASDTSWALIVLLGAAAFFFAACALFRRGGVRQAVRAVSAVGCAVSLLAIAQAATAGRDIYWRFRTEFEGPLPFGPFVNRNHFATWAIMALPLCLGYLAARSGSTDASPAHVASRTRLAHAIDPRTAWLMAAAAVTLVALLLSLSRSGTLALGLSAIATVVVCRHRLDASRRRRVLAAAAVMVVCGLAWADLSALGARVAGAPSDVANRLTIWRETMPIVRDFWLTGSGAGTYQRAMFVYQQSPRGVYFNQAHNHYLQVAAEGGVLVAGAVILALAAFLRAARARLTGDRSGLFWIRAGAACGLGAVALQSVWETGLVMPANAALAALLAAVVVFERP